MLLKLSFISTEVDILNENTSFVSVLLISLSLRLINLSMLELCGVWLDTLRNCRNLSLDWILHNNIRIACRVLHIIFKLHIKESQLFFLFLQC